MACINIFIKSLHESIIAKISSLKEVNVSVALKRENNFHEIHCFDKTSRINVDCSIVCSVGILDRTHELFYVREGVFLLSDGKKLKVLKYELSE